MHRFETLLVVCIATLLQQQCSIATNPQQKYYHSLQSAIEWPPARWWLSIGYTPRARLLSDLATECRRHEVAKLLGNQARGVQPACTMTTQNSKIRLISSIALKSRLITYLST